MSSVSIVGPGTMARTVGTRAVAAGHHVQIVGRDADRAAHLAAGLGGGATSATLDDPLTGDLVVLAVPYAQAAGVVARYGAALVGKVVVDVTNPFTPDVTGLVTPDGSSGAQEIARSAAGGVQVVKAFNTLFAGVLAAGRIAGRPADVFLAGDDADARKAVAVFVESLGLHPRDVGRLAMAHWLEGLGLLLVGQAVADQDFGLGVAILG